VPKAGIPNNGPQRKTQFTGETGLGNKNSKHVDSNRKSPTARKKKGGKWEGQLFKLLSLTAEGRNESQEKKRKKVGEGTKSLYYAG